MALEYVGGTSGTGGSGSYTVSLTSLSGGVGSAPQAGDIVVVISGFASSIDLDPGPTTSGYTEVADLYHNDSNDANLSVAYKIMGATPDTSVTVEGSGATNAGAAAVIHVWRGVDLENPLDVAVVTNTGGNSGLADAPAITPITSGAIVLACTGGTDDSTPNTFDGQSGVSNEVHVQSLGSIRTCNLAVGSISWNGSGSIDPSAWTTGGNTTAHSWTAVTLALRPAADSGSGISATLNKALDSATVSSSVTIDVTGQLSKTLDSSSLSAQSAVEVQGALSVVLDDAVLSATVSGVSEISADLAIVLDDATVTTTSAIEVQGQVSVSLDDAEISSTSAVEVQGLVSVNLDDAEVSSSSEVLVQAIVSKILDNAVVSSTASYEDVVSGSVNVVLDDASVSAEAAVEVSAQLSRILDNAQLSASSEVEVSAVLSMALEDAVCSSTASVIGPIQCVVDVQLEDATLSSSLLNETPQPATAFLGFFL